MTAHGIPSATTGVALLVFALCACSPGDDPSAEQPARGGAGGAGGGIQFTGGASAGGSPDACPRCSFDGHDVIDCDGNVVATCALTDGCDPLLGICTNACAAARHAGSSVGCEYYATMMDQLVPEPCFAAFVANTWTTPAHVAVEFDGATLPVQAFARVPKGFGPTLTYEPFDPTAGLAPGEVAVLFLSGPQGTEPVDAGDATSVPCPVASARPEGVMLHGQTGIGKSFRITTDVPVVAYQMNPFGGGKAATTGASLLLPTSTWGTNYVAVNAKGDTGDIEPPPWLAPSLNIVASEDATTVKMVPVAGVEGHGGVPLSMANAVMTLELDRGEHAQITQHDLLTGSVLQSDKPIGLMAGHVCLFWSSPFGACDHAEQSVPPIQALGSRYVGVKHPARYPGEGPTLWNIIGAVDGTELSWSNDVGGPAALARGQTVEFETADPFVVESQGDSHPFLLFSYMRGGGTEVGYGTSDPDFVWTVPPQQYLHRYVFFADPTYPETALILVRSRVGGEFADVELDCAGKVAGWIPVGDYEWARVVLTTGDFQNVGSCSTGRHEITSAAPFGAWLWGWGTEATGTGWVSYGYPVGMGVQPINRVDVPAVPK